GAAVASGLADAGAQVHGLDLAYETDSRFDAAICDITDETAIRAALDRIIGVHGSLDGLVNNAGISLPPDDSYGRDPFLRTLAVNTLAPLRLGWLAAQAMTRADRRG